MRIRDYRAKARQLLAGKWGMAILVTFVASLFGALLVGSGASFNLNIDESFLEFVPERLQNILLSYITIVGSIAGLLGMAGSASVRPASEHLHRSSEAHEGRS